MMCAPPTQDRNIIENDTEEANGRSGLLGETDDCSEEDEHDALSDCSVGAASTARGVLSFYNTVATILLCGQLSSEMRIQKNKRGGGVQAYIASR